MRLSKNIIKPIGGNGVKHNIHYIYILKLKYITQSIKSIMWIYLLLTFHFKVKISLFQPIRVKESNLTSYVFICR